MWKFKKFFLEKREHQKKSSNYTAPHCLEDEAAIFEERFIFISILKFSFVTVVEVVELWVNASAFSPDPQPLENDQNGPSATRSSPHKGDVHPNHYAAFRVYHWNVGRHAFTSLKGRFIRLQIHLFVFQYPPKTPQSECCPKHLPLPSMRILIPKKAML